MEFLSLSRRRSSARNVPSEERGKRLFSKDKLNTQKIGKRGRCLLYTHRLEIIMDGSVIRKKRSEIKGSRVVEQGWRINDGWIMDGSVIREKRSGIKDQESPRIIGIFCYPICFMPTTLYPLLSHITQHFHVFLISYADILTSYTPIFWPLQRRF